MHMTVEQVRVSLQKTLDEGRSAQLRNRLGQFATPAHLARDVVRCGLQLLGPEVSIRFLDPAFGTGSFYSALLEAQARVSTAAGFEIDSHYGIPAIELWRESGLQLTLDKRSGIVNDPNRADDPEYVVRLIGQVITVSLETMKIVKALPELIIQSPAERIVTED
jgi:predicted helicase